MEHLTPKQKIVLQAIRQYFARNSKMPTIRGIKDLVFEQGLVLSSTRSIFNYLNALEEKGFIKRNSERRGIELEGGLSNSFVDIPILGCSSAGDAIMFADEYVEGHLKVSKKMIGSGNYFAVEVCGTSMNLSELNGKKIEDGDYIIIDSEAQDYKSGNRVLVVLGGLATVKRYERDGDVIKLLPESSDKKHKPIYLTPDDDFIINGLVIDVLKK